MDAKVLSFIESEVSTDGSDEDSSLLSRSGGGSFIPPFLMQSWARATSPDEVSSCLEEVSLAFQSFDASEKAKFTDDAALIVSQTIPSLSSDSGSVLIHALSLLLHVAEFHPSVFMGSMGPLLSRLEMFLCDSRHSIRNNAVRLISTLVVRLPFDVMGPYLLHFLENPGIKPCLATKLMCLGLLYCRTSAGRSESRLDKFVEYLLNWMQQYLIQQSVEVEVTVKSKDDDVLPALFDLVCVITRVYLVDPFEQAVIRVDSRTHTFSSIMGRVSSNITAMLRDLPISDSAKPHIVTRAVQLEFQSLIHDVDMAASYWYVLSLPLPKRAQHLLTESESQQLPNHSSLHGEINPPKFARQSKLDSPTESVSVSATPHQAAPNLASHLNAEFSGLKLSIPDVSNSSPHLSPTANQMRKSPNRRPSGKLEHIPLPMDKVIFEHESSPDQDLPLSGRKPSLAHLPEQAAEEAKVALSFANPGSPLALHRDKSSSNLPKVQGLSGVLSSIPYQPPPTSWGNALGDFDAGMHDASPSRSATTTSGVTTSSSASSTQASVPPIDTLGSGEEDWQRVNTAAPWMYLPTSAASPYGDNMRAGLMSPAQLDEPMDRSKLSSLKRPGRNFRSSGSSGAPRRHSAHKEDSDKRAFSADASMDGLLVTSWSAPMTPGAVVEEEGARWTAGRRPSESASSPLNQIAEGSHDELGSMEGNADLYMPINNLNIGQSLPDIASPVRSQKLEQGCNHSQVANKSEIIYKNGKPNLVAAVSGLKNPHQSHPRNAADLIGVSELGRTSASEATGFDDGGHISLGDRTSFKSDTDYVSRSLDIPLSSIRRNDALYIDMADAHASFDSSEQYSESQSIESSLSKKKRVPLSPRAKNAAIGASRKSAIAVLSAEDTKSPEANARFPKIKGEKAKPTAIDTRTATEVADSECISHQKIPENYDYIASEELTRLQHPSQDLMLVVEGLQKDEWPQIFYTLNKLRQLVLHHKDIVLSGDNLHQLVVGVTKQANSLRSVVCKNALLAISDMFMGLGKAMDIEASGLAPLLFKRCADSSIFINQSANTALFSMLSSISTGRVIGCLMQCGLDHKTAAVRGVAAALVTELIELKPSELKTASTCREQFDALKQKLPKMLADSSPAVRAHARDAVRRILQRDVLTRAQLEALVTASVLDKAISENTNPVGPLQLAKPSASSVCSADGGLTDTENDHVGDMLRAVSKRAANGVIASPSVRSGIPSPSTSGTRKTKATAPSSSIRKQGDDGSKIEPPIELGVSGRASGAQSMNSDSSPDSTSRFSALQAAQARKELDSIPELLLLPDIHQRLQSKNWLERNNAITQMVQIIVEHAEALQKSGRLDRLVESILERLEDGSVKVALHALQCLGRIHDERPAVFASMYSVAVPVFLNAMAASNKQIAVLACSIYGRVADTIEPYSNLLQLLTTVAAHEKDRMRCAAFGAISNFIQSHWRHSGTFISGSELAFSQRVIFPTICQTVCANATKPEVRSAACDALRQLQGCVEEPLWKWTSNSQQQMDIKKYVA